MRARALILGALLAIALAVVLTVGHGHQAGVVRHGQNVHAAGDPLLLGSTSEPTTLEEEPTERVAAWQVEAAHTGVVEELQFKVSANTQEATGVVLGVYANTGSGSEERPGAVLAQGTKAGRPEPSEVVKVTGLSLTVSSGTKYWLAFLPTGGKLNYNLNLSGTTHSRIIRNEHVATTIKEWPVESEWFGLGSFGPIFILANGTEGTPPTPSGARKVVMMP